MSDKHEDGKTPGQRIVAPVTRRDAFKRIASTLMGGVALAIGGPLAPQRAEARYFSTYSSYSSRSYFSRYSSYFSRYSSYFSRYSSYFSRYSSRYSSYFSRYSSYSSRYNSQSTQQRWQREDRYRSQQNQVVKDSINKQIEQQNRNRYHSTAPYQSRYTSFARPAYTSRAPVYSSRAQVGYTSRYTPSYTSRAPLYTSRAPAYSSRAQVGYTSRATAPVPQKAPARPEAKAPPKGKTPYSSWYCSQGLWHRYSSLA